MPLDFSKYVFQPRPLQQFDFGSGFRDLADARLRRQTIDNQDAQAKASLGEQQAQRQDTNSLSAANFAKDRSNTEYDAANKRYLEGAKLAEQALTAQQGNDIPTIEALGPLLPQYGGGFDRVQKPDGTFDYKITAPQQPSRGQIDVQRTRGDIFGGGGDQQAPRPGGPLFSEKNPFDSPATPGASAAAAGQQAPQGAAAPPPDANPQNPLNPPSFQPMHQSDIVARNQGLLKPYFEGLQSAVPDRFRDRMGGFTGGASALGLSPEKTLTATQPQLEQMTGLWRGEMAAEGQAGRLAMQQGALEQREEDRQFANDLKLRDRAERGADKIVGLQSLQDVNKKYQSGKDAEDLLVSAEENPTSATALIEQLYRMRNTGVMTDTDFTHAKDGVVSFHQAVKNGVVELFLKDHGGLNPDTTKMMREYLDIAMQGHRRKLMAARDGLYRQWKFSKTDVERDAIEGKMRGFFPEEFYPAEFNDGVSPGENMGPGDEQLVSDSPPPTDNVGKMPLPKTLDGRPKVSPNGVRFEPGRIGKKPPKNAAKMTDKQLDDSNEDDLMDMLRGAAGAP